VSVLTLMDDPSFDRRETLLAQRNRIAAQTHRLQEMLNLIDRTVTALEGGVQMSKEESEEINLAIAAYMRDATAANARRGRST